MSSLAGSMSGLGSTSTPVQSTPSPTSQGTAGTQTSNGAAPHPLNSSGGSGVEYHASEAFSVLPAWIDTCYRASGILPYSRHNGQVHFLLGAESRREAMCWHVFGGKKEINDGCAENTALREFHEELGGVLSDSYDQIIEALRSTKGTKIWEWTGKFVLYIVEIPLYDADAPKKFADLKQSGAIGKTTHQRIAWVSGKEFLALAYGPARNAGEPAPAVEGLPLFAFLVDLLKVPGVEQALVTLVSPHAASGGSNAAASAASAPARSAPPAGGAANKYAARPRNPSPPKPRPRSLPDGRRPSSRSRSPDRRQQTSGAGRDRDVRPPHPHNNREPHRYAERGREHYPPPSAAGGRHVDERAPDYHRYPPAGGYYDRAPAAYAPAYDYAAAPRGGYREYPPPPPPPSPGYGYRGDPYAAPGYAPAPPPPAYDYRRPPPPAANWEASSSSYGYRGDGYDRRGHPPASSSRDYY